MIPRTCSWAVRPRLGGSKGRIAHVTSNTPSVLFRYDAIVRAGRNWPTKSSGPRKPLIRRAMSFISFSFHPFVAPHRIPRYPNDLVNTCNECQAGYRPPEIGLFTGGVVRSDSEA